MLVSLTIGKTGGFNAVDGAGQRYCDTAANCLGRGGVVNSLFICASYTPAGATAAIAGVPPGSGNEPVILENAFLDNPAIPSSDGAGPGGVAIDCRCRLRQGVADAMIAPEASWPHNQFKMFIYYPPLFEGWGVGY